MDVKKMNTQEAIEFTESFKDRITSIDIEEGNTESIKTYNNEIDKVINLLQQGEKYRQIVNYLEKYCGYYYYGSSDNLSQLIPRLKQKYLEEAKQDKANEQVEN